MYPDGALMAIFEAAGAEVGAAEAATVGCGAIEGMRFCASEIAGTAASARMAHLIVIETKKRCRFGKGDNTASDSRI